MTTAEERSRARHPFTKAKEKRMSQELTHYMEAASRLRDENTEMRKKVWAALDELGVPNKDYPAPVANAVRILREAVG